MLFNIEKFDKRAQLSKSGFLYIYTKNTFITYLEGNRIEYSHDIIFPDENEYSADRFNLIKKNNEFYIFCAERFLRADINNVRIKNNEILIRIMPSRVVYKYNAQLKFLFSSCTLKFNDPAPRYFLFEDKFIKRKQLENLGYIIPVEFNNYDFSQKIVKHPCPVLNILMLSKKFYPLSVEKLSDFSLLDIKVAWVVLLIFKQKKIPYNIARTILAAS